MHGVGGITLLFAGKTAALRRLPPATASMATLITPVVGEFAGAPVLG